MYYRIIAFAMVCCACAGSIQITRTFTIKLTKVEGGKVASLSGGRITASERTSTFEDPILRIEFDKAIDTQIEFVMRNKTNSPLTILWNESSYIDTNGQSHKVMHKGTRLIERNEEIVPTVIPPKSFISDLIAPASYTFWREGVTGYVSSKWKTNKLIGDGQATEGKTLGVFLSIRSGEMKDNYLFSFTIETITTETRRRQTWY